MNPPEDPKVTRRRSPARLFAASSATQVKLAPVMFVAPTVPMALCAAVAFTVDMGTSMASLMSLPIRRYAKIRGAVMSLNTVGVNVGMIGRATIAIIGLGLYGYGGLSMILATMAAGGVATLLLTQRAFDDTVETAAGSAVAA